MIWAETLNVLSDTLLALGGFFVTFRLVQAHWSERRGLAATDDDEKNRRLQRAKTIRQLASLQHPAFLGLIALVTLAKVFAGVVLLL